jgi:DNA-directed RNA polymerase subunit RPC12/RpoP
MTTPYREPIKLAPLLGEPKPLMPFHPWWPSGRLTTRAAIECNFPNWRERSSEDKRELEPVDAFCPGCSFNTLFVIATLCAGKEFGLCKKGCAETREHFHVKCRKCGFRALMAPRAPGEIDVAKDSG